MKNYIIKCLIVSNGFAEYSVEASSVEEAFEKHRNNESIFQGNSYLNHHIDKNPVDYEEHEINIEEWLNNLSKEKEE